MKKVLFVSHVANFVKFNEAYIRWFKEQGWEVHYASAGEEPILCCDKSYKIPFNRSFTSLNNIKAYFNLKNLLKTQQYDIIHCHTPTGGVIARLAAKKQRKNGTKVIYTAHGFHFYKNSPWYYWLIFYTIEKFCARFTDALVLINNEDYNTAVAKHFKAKNIFKINGVGVDLNKFYPVKYEVKQQIRNELGLEIDAFIMLYCAEFTANKNHKLIVSSIPKIIEKNQNIKILFLGKGALINETKTLVSKMTLDKYVAFYGYRKDLEKFYRAVDIEISASNREGLSVHIMEAMATGLPIVATDIRGHSDLITDGENGYLFKCNDTDGFTNCINKIIHNKKISEQFGNENLIRVQKYNLPFVIEQMADIYKKFM